MAKHHLAVSDPARQVASVLLELLDRDSQARRTGRAPTIRVSQNDLAALLGRSRMTTRKGLDTLKKSGLIRVGYGCIELLDLRALQTMVA